LEEDWKKKWEDVGGGGGIPSSLLCSRREADDRLSGGREGGRREELLGEKKGGERRGEGDAAHIHTTGPRRGQGSKSEARHLKRERKKWREKEEVWMKDCMVRRDSTG